MNLLNKGSLRALALLSQIGVSMLVPIIIFIWIYNRFFSSNAILLLFFIFLGVAVAYRNVYMIFIREERLRKTQSGKGDGEFKKDKIAND